MFFDSISTSVPSGIERSTRLKAVSRMRVAMTSDSKSADDGEGSSIAFSVCFRGIDQGPVKELTCAKFESSRLFKMEGNCAFGDLLSLPQCGGVGEDGSSHRLIESDGRLRLHVFALLLSDRLVALEGFAGVLQTQYRTQAGTAEGVGEHLRAVAQDVPEIVSQH